MKDKLFLDPGKRQADFAFDEEVVAVFGDMLERSIPFYFEIQNMIVDLAEEFAAPDTAIYDLGCSTGTTLALLGRRLQDKEIRLHGIESSLPMLKKAETNLDSLKIKDYRLEQQDLNNGVKMNDASVAILNLVLQFVRPINRDRLIKDTFAGLRDGGCLILVEKVTSTDSRLNRKFIDCYHEFKKRNLYTDMEIARKREALENILIPYRVEENIELLHRNDFRTVETFFRWFNFCGLIALKK
ncbi:MAG TPA: carboxy-S-adenosyl-L-methionine synthase CmoA [Gammaproteobacteria bacterium]